jgi:hypothetical protein
VRWGVLRNGVFGGVAEYGWVNAADLPKPPFPKTAAAQSPGFDWSGWYVGGHFAGDRKRVRVAGALVVTLATIVLLGAKETFIPLPGLGAAFVFVAARLRLIRGWWPRLSFWSCSPERISTAIQWDFRC